jgi:hypothetical protein
MKRVLAVGAGLAGGILLAGILTAATVPLLPPSFRSEALVWIVGLVTVTLTVCAAWAWSSPPRE